MGAFQQMAEERVAVQLLLGQKSRTTPRPHQQVAVGERIEVRNVIARHQKGALAREVLKPFEPPIEPKPDERPKRPFREAKPGFRSAHGASWPWECGLF